ncbi:hypothetical protein [Sinisalibacter lacisalsi]|uniref:Lipoprotein n=1 Tax=Sinisalibacter lacisalsi TaxID=1526570 RepID=A0ABQ1QM17_9RHOB|nr:hypothetical protein [Sinisalibacter lacisalsi]GGD34765.1 hypothetical protein GCM10011358_18500 [Sinisalibacter lacisalsi]
MTLRAAHIASAGALALAACAETESPVSRDALPFDPVYLGIETGLLDGDLVQFDVSMRGARDTEDVADYGECAAAQYALIRGYGFARHVRTNVQQQGSVWTGNAVYVISDALPQGLRTIDAEVTVAACEDNGIPTI